MIHSQSKYNISAEPSSYTNGATASLVIDTKGALTGNADAAAGVADYLAIDVAISRSNNSTNVPSAFKLQHSDITNATGYADVTSSSFTSAVTTQSTSAVNNYSWYVDTRPLKRYVKVVIVPVTTQVISISANLFRNAVCPTALTSTAQGLSAAPIVL